jgi:hypothetical protein
MIDKPVAQIGIEDLQRLVANKVSEPRSLEYKQALPGGTDSEKKEFLGDVSAFANASVLPGEHSSFPLINRFRIADA